FSINLLTNRKQRSAVQENHHCCRNPAGRRSSSVGAGVERQTNGRNVGAELLAVRGFPPALLGSFRLYISRHRAVCLVWSSAPEMGQPRPRGYRVPYCSRLLWCFGTCG